MKDMQRYNIIEEFDPIIVQDADYIIKTIDDKGTATFWIENDLMALTARSMNLTKQLDEEYFEALSADDFRKALMIYQLFMECPDLLGFVDEYIYCKQLRTWIVKVEKVLDVN